MRYIMIKSTMLHFKKPIWRTFYVNEDITLIEFGASVLSVFNAGVGFMFYFKTKDKTRYVDKSWLNNKYDRNKKYYKSFNEVTLKDVLDDLDNLRLFYDTGDNYEFDFHICGKDKEYKRTNKKLILKAGEGYGVLESGAEYVRAIIDGKDIVEFVEQETNLMYDEYLDCFSLDDFRHYFDELNIKQLQENIEDNLYYLDDTFDRY